MPNEDLETAMGSLQHREFQIRAVDTEKREVEGIAVPWGQVADLGWFTEEVQRGAVQDSEDTQLWWRHTDPIGMVSAHEDQDGGWFIRTKISKTTLGDDALTLARDGVVKNFSIGFEPVEYTTREDGDKVHITHTNIRVREVSLVPLPAYDGAKVTNVRQGISPTRKVSEMPTLEEAPATQKDVLEVRDAVSEIERRMATFRQAPEAPVADTRSAGQILKAIAAGDESVIREYNELMQRDFTGGTTADTVMKPGWVGDLTRIIGEASPLVGFFASGALPPTGMSIEYAQLKSNTVAYGKQPAEGADLPYGKVQIETKTAPVETYGGWSELSRQTIERASVNVLQTTLEAQAVAAGKAMNAAMRAAFLALHTSQTAAANTVEIPVAPSYQSWINAIVDAAIKYDDLGLNLDGLLVNAVLFKALANLEASDGRPVLLVQGNGVNNIGTLNPTALSANLANVTVTLDAGWKAGAAATDPMGAFANKRALRSYISPVTRLQDENIINLSKQYSVYNYAAFAPEIPAAVVPVTFATV